MATMANAKKREVLERKKIESEEIDLELEEVEKLEKKPMAVDIIVTHNEPHVDEIVGRRLLIMYGQDLFPGVEKAPIMLWSEGRMISEFRGRTADDLLEKERMFLIGCGNGMFDEHGKKAPTCAHLIAAYLGVRKNPELQKILNFCKRVDNDGESMPLDLHNLVKESYADSDGSEEAQTEIFLWADRGIKKFLAGQINFFLCEDDWNETGKLFNGIASCISDNRKMNKWVRFKMRPDLFIQISTTRHVQIFPSYSDFSRKIPEELIKVLRILEREKRHRLWWKNGEGVGERNQPFHLPHPSWEGLEKEGFIEESPWWYLSKHEQGWQIYNGTVTAPDIESTILSREKIEEAAQFVLDILSHHQCFECYGYLCPAFRFEMKYCRQTRAAEKTSVG